LLGILVRKATPRGAVMGVLAGILVTLWGTLCQDLPGDYARFNYPLHAFLIGPTGTLAIVLVGWLGSLGQHKAESRERKAEEEPFQNASNAMQHDLQKRTLAHQGLAMGGFLIVAIETQTLEKLPPPTRAALLMTLLGILLLGRCLVTAILLSGHWVRKLGKHQRGPIVPPDVAPLRPHGDAKDIPDRHRGVWGDTPQ